MLTYRVFVHKSLGTPPSILQIAPLRKVCEYVRIPMHDSSAVVVCQRGSASEAACPVRRAKEGFCKYPVVQAAIMERTFR